VSNSGKNLVSLGIKKLLFSWAKAVLRQQIASPILSYYVIQKIKNSTPNAYIANRKYKLLLLSPNRFPSGELDALFRTQEFDLLYLEKEVLYKLISIFWDRRVPLEATLSPGKVGVDRGIFLTNRKRLRRGYRNLIKDILRRYHVDAVIGAAPHYNQNHDFGIVANGMGVPYIILMKECLITNTKHHERIVNYYSEMDKGGISHVIVHNKSTKDAIAESKLLPVENITSLGCMRMDGYVSRVSNQDLKCSTRINKQVVLFSFIYGVGLYGWTSAHPPVGGPGYFVLFDDVHQVFGELAAENPHITFIIKAKWPDIWLDEIKASIRQIGVRVDELENISITAMTPAHDLILSSDVVVSFGSTTLLEGAIAGKPVIVPDFAEASLPDYQGYIQLKDTYDVYDVATSRSELKQLVLRRITDSYISDSIKNRRVEYFEKYISTIDGRATVRCVGLIKKLINLKRSK